MTPDDRAAEIARYDCVAGRHRWVTASGERRYTCGECDLDAVDAISTEREACAVVGADVALNGTEVAAAIRARTP